MRAPADDVISAGSRYWYTYMARDRAAAGRPAGLGRRALCLAGVGIVTHQRYITN
jgi:hypothetical protein